jgi:hypothetical protein
MNRRFGPWQRSLLATSALSGAFVAASLLWQSGNPQWAFVIAFITTWITLSVAWSDVDYTEESGVQLAQIMDHNFDRLQDRLEELEQQLEALRRRDTGRDRRAS